MENTEWFDIILGENSPAHTIIKRRIEFMAAEACRQNKAGLVEADAEDIAQQLWLALCQCGDKYDPSRGDVTTFCYQELKTALNTLLRKRFRDSRRVNMDTRPIYIDSDEAKTAGAVPEGGLKGKPLSPPPCNAEECRAFIRGQDELLRPLLLRVLNGERLSIAAMAREVGIPLSTFRRNHFDRVRENFGIFFGYVAD